MSTNKDKKNPKLEIKESMLVIVNRDWNRTYAASIRPVTPERGERFLSAKCSLKNTNIISHASNKNQLSANMDELATIVEDRLSTQAPSGTLKIAGLNYFLS